MDIRQLGMLHALVRGGSISAAARSLGISQPAVSKSLRKLEADVGFALFSRSHRGLAPTSEARRLLPEIERICGDIDRLGAMVANLKSGEEGELRVAAIPSLAMGLIAPAVAQLAARRPFLGISALTMLASQVIDLVTSRRAEIGFTFSALQHPDLVFSAFDRRALVALVPRRHPLADNDVVTPADLKGVSVTTLPSDQPLGIAVDEVFRQHRLAPARRIEISHSFLAWTLVSRGAGVAVVDPYVVSALAAPQVLVRPFHPRIEVTAFVAHARGAPLSVAGKEFLSLVRENALCARGRP